MFTFGERCEPNLKNHVAPPAMQNGAKTLVADGGGANGKEWMSFRDKPSEEEKTKVVRNTARSKKKKDQRYDTGGDTPV